MDHKLKIKVIEKVVKYLDVSRSLKKLQKVKVTIIIIFVGTLGTVPKEPGKVAERPGDKR